MPIGYDGALNREGVAMKLLQLRYLIQVAETGSFTKAATKLNVAQPALSRQIKLLEDELGVSLFRRDGRGVEPTAAGNELVRRSMDIFKHLFEAREAVMAYRGQTEGEVTIGILPLFGAAVMPDLLLRCRDEYPGLTIKVMVGMSGAVQEWLMSGRVDFGVISSLSDTGQFIKTSRIATALLHLVCRAQDAPNDDGPVPLAQALNAPLIIPSRANGIGSVIHGAAERENIPLQPTLEVDSVEIIKGLVLSGVGSTLLPRFAIEKEIRSGVFKSREVADRALEYHVELASLADRPLSKHAGIVAETLKSVSDGLRIA
jgi:LysR family nitrogen assimilation transcriptional regulator